MESEGIWVEPRPEYYVQTGSMFENPYGVPHDEIRSYINNNPPEIVAQVVFGKYVELSGLVFTAELINEMFDHEMDRVRGESFIDQKRWEQANIAHSLKPDPYRFAIGVDLARKKDHTVITVLDTGEKPARVVYWKRTNRVPWPEIYAEIGRALFLFPGELLIDETGAGGDVVKEELEGRCYCPVHHVSYDAASPCPRGNNKACNQDAILRFQPDGFTFTASSKVQLINHLQSCLGRGYRADQPDARFGAVRSPPIGQLEEELSTFAWDDKKLQTDCVMSLALACWQGLEQEVEDAIAGSPYGR